MQCPACGRDNAFTMRSCSTCGSILPAAGQPAPLPVQQHYAPAAAGSICPNCHIPMVCVVSKPQSGVGCLLIVLGLCLLLFLIGIVLIVIGIILMSKRERSLVCPQCNYLVPIGQ